MTRLTRPESAAPSCRAVTRLAAPLRERVGDELELRLLGEAGGGGADEQRVAVDAGEGVDPGRGVLAPQRLAGPGVEGVQRAGVVAREVQHLAGGGRLPRSGTAVRRRGGQSAHSRAAGSRTI